MESVGEIIKEIIDNKGDNIWDLFPQIPRYPLAQSAFNENLR